jgi:membrane-associated phospholipid phosphatase
MALVLLLAVARPAAALEPLPVDLRVDLPVTAGAGVAALVLSLKSVQPADCRWCQPDTFDRKLQSHLVWSNTAAAGHLSDALAIGAIPVGAAGVLALSARNEGGDLRSFFDDGVVVAEAVLISTALNAGVKDATARQRPSGAANVSFYSGHASFAFSLATATATVSTIRGYRLTPWVWAAGMVLATGVAYLRVAGNEHWTTDVLVGAVAGGGIGFAVPWVFHRGPERPAVALVPAPGGFGLIW